MKIKKILEKNGIEIIRTKEEVSFFKNSILLTKDEVINEIKLLFIINNIEDKKYTDFFDNKIQLKELFIVKKIDDDFFNTLIKNQKILSIQDENIKEQITKLYVNLNKNLKSRYGDKFVKLIGHLFHNANKTISQINSNEFSHVQKIYKSITNNVIKNSTIQLNDASIKLDKNISEVLKKYLNKTVTNELLKTITKDNQYKMISLLNKDIKRTLCKSNKFDKNTRQIQKIYYSIKKDINYFVVNKIVKQKQEYNCERIMSEITNILNKKIKVFEDNKSSNFIHQNDHVMNPNVTVNDYNLILSHSIYKLYRNLATIVGCMIVNYNIKSGNSDFYDFSTNQEEFLQMLNDEKNYNSLSIENFKDNITKKSIFNSIQMFRNTIMHIRNLNNIENNLESDIIEKLQTLSISNIKEKFNVHKINVETIYVWELKKISLSFSRIYNKIKLEHSKSNKNKNKLWTHFFEQEHTNIEEFNSKKFYLNWIYDNDFQKFLSNLECDEWLNYIEKFNNVEKKKHLNWEEAIIIKELKVKIKSFNNNCSEKVSMFLNTKLGENEKNKSIVENLWKCIFTDYAKHIYSHINEYMNSNNILSNKKQEYKIKTNKNNVSFHWIVYPLLILNISELAKTKKYLENFYNRTFKNKKVYEQRFNIKEEYQFLIDEQEINNLIRIVNLVITSKKDIITDSEKSKVLKEPKIKDLWEKLYPQDKIIENYNYLENNSHNNFFKVINYENFNLFKDVLTNLIQNYNFLEIENFEKLDTKKYDLMNSQIQRYKNRQSIIDAIELKKEINYFFINWVMHRQFDVYNVLTAEDKAGLGKLKDIIEQFEKNIDNDNAKSVKKLQDIIKKNESKVEKLLHKLSIIKKINNSNLSIIYTYITQTYKLFQIYNEYKDSTYENRKERLKKQLEIVKKLQPIKLKELWNINYHTKILSNILHMNHFGNETEKEEYLEKYQNLKSTINTLRNELQYQRNKKNQITPSIMRMCHKKGLILEFDFFEHQIQKINIKPRQIELKDYDNKTKFTHDMLLDEEIKIYEQIILSDVNN